MAAVIKNPQYLKYRIKALVTVLNNVTNFQSKFSEKCFQLAFLIQPFFPL